MIKYVKATLIFITFFSLAGGAYAFTSPNIDPILRDYLFFAMIPVSSTSLFTLAILVIVDYIKNSRHKNNANQDTYSKK